MTDRRKKGIALELEAQTKDVRHQLNEQLRCLDQRLDSHCSLTMDLMEFYRLRAEIEQEYSKSLDRLLKQFKLRQKPDKQKRETCCSYSTNKMWQNLLDSTATQSRNHTVLSEGYGSVSVKGFQQILDDLQGMYCKCRDIATSLHQEVAKVLGELQNSMETYHIYHEQSRQSETKLRRAEMQKAEHDAKRSSGSMSRRLIYLEKQTEKHRARLESTNQKVMKARNDYLLSIETANACIHKYFMEDLPELMDAMDYGYHVSMGQTMTTNVQLEKTVCLRHIDLLQCMQNDAHDLNLGVDLQAFIQASHPTFSLPKKYEYQPHMGDRECELVALRPVQRELSERLKVIVERTSELKLQNEELWKTLVTTDKTMMERTLKEFDVESFFKDDRSQGKTPIELEKPKAERTETQLFYLNKLKEFLVNRNMIARLQARSMAIEKALINSNVTVMKPMPIVPRMTKKKQLGKATLEGRPKLFGGSIEEYVHATGQEIPLIIRCCINIINLHGMHQQGLFRTSGTQHEVNEFKNIFERGEEVVLKVVEMREINCIAGALKLYFRELREPLFPLQLFDELISCIRPDQTDSDLKALEKSISRIKELLLPLPRATVTVMRYLFAFLNHVTEHSDENLMDARNLAICFGPTLLPMPPERANSQSKVNDLVQLLIVHHEKIFPNDGGVIYEKCMTESCEFEDCLDLALDTVDSIPGLKSEDSGDEESSNIEAIALYDFDSRTGRELSFKKGDLLVLKRRLSENWWEGLSGTQQGLVPDRYVTKNRESVSGEERLRTSSESLPSKPSEITLDASPTVEGFDRSKSESDICDDLVSSSAAVEKSSLSTTTSDLSHGDSSVATWSGKSSSSKDMIEEPVLLTDTELASPMAKETQQMESEVFPFCKTQESLDLPGEMSAREVTEGSVFTIASFSTDNVNEDSQSLTITEAGDSTAAEFLASDSSSETHLKTLVLDDASDTPEQNLTPDDSLQTFSNALSRLSEADVGPMLPLPKVSSAYVCYKDKDEQTLDAFAFAVSEQIMSEGDRKRYDLPIKGRDDLATARKDDLLEDRNIAFVPSDVQGQNDATGALDLSEFGQQRVSIKSLDPLQVLDEVIDHVDPEELLAAALAEINRTIDSFTSKASILPQVVQGSCVAQNLQGEPLPLIQQVPLSSDEPLSTSGKVARVPPLAVVNVPSSDILPPPMEDILLSCNPQPPDELRDLTTMSVSLTDFPEPPGELDPSQSDLVPLFVGQTPPSSPPSSEDFPPPPEDLPPLSSPFHFFAEMVASGSSDSSTKASTDEQTFGPVSVAEHKMAPIVRTRSPTSCQFSASNVSVGLPCPDKVSGGEPPVTLLRHDKLEESALECHPGPDTLAGATDVSLVCHPHPDTVSADKAKPKPPPVMKKPPKPKGGQ